MEPVAPQIAVGAVVLVHDETGEQASSAVIPGSARVLLIRRGRPPRKGSWSLPGGRVMRGERLTDAVAREVMEETHLSVTVGALVEVIEMVDPEHHYVILDYVARPSAGLAGLRAGDDAADARLVAVSELDDYQVTDAVKRVVQRAWTLRHSVP